MLLIISRARIFSIASIMATKAPVIEAVRVPPSAWITSQSIQIVRSPSAGRLVTDRSDRPISRWISWVRPPTLPVLASRVIRVFVARGSMPYSAVTHPLPVLRRNGGTRSSTLAVQMTRVRPTSIRTEPSAWARKPGVRRVSRRSVAARPSLRVIVFSSLLLGTHPAQLLLEGMPQIDVPGERVHFLAVDQDLGALDRRQVDGQHVHEG